MYFDRTIFLCILQILNFNIKTSKMKNLTLSLVVLFVSTLSYGQISFNTGSAELDADLNIINSDAKADLPSFKASLSAEFSVSTKKVDYMLSLNMAPGDVYVSLSISNIGGKSIDDVIDCYKTNKSKGWGYIAKEMGIKPGSPEFHALKGKGKNKSSKGKSGNSGKGNSNGKGNNGKGGKKK
jgi:hypothetical protein